MATNTASTLTDLTGNGSAGPFPISFSYLSKSDVQVTVNNTPKDINTHYTFTSTSEITFTTGNEPANGAAIRFQRNTNISTKKVDFQDGSLLTEADLDANSDHLLFSMQELVDGGAGFAVDTSDKVDGSIVYYDQNSAKFKADTTTTKLTIVNGGNF